MSNMLTTDYVLTRGVEQILPTKQGLAKLMATRKISLYEGFDPTSPSLHIGHLIGIRKLAQFQKLFRIQQPLPFVYKTGEIGQGKPFY